MASQACPELPKLKHNKFPGQELWTACLAGNKEAWREMEAYNRRDVEATERVYKWLAPFGTGVDFNVFREDTSTECSCGSTHFHRRGYAYTPSGKYQIYQCQNCGAYGRGKDNLFLKKSARR